MPRTSARMACAAIQSGSRLPRGMSRPACRTAFPGPAASPVAMSSTSGSRSAPGPDQPRTCSPQASPGAGAPRATVRAASAASAPRPETGSSPHCRTPWTRPARTHPHLTPSPDMPACTAATTIRSAPRPARNRGPGSTGSARRSSPNSCTSARPARSSSTTNAVHRLSQLPNLVTGDGRSLTWTPYRYSVYLQWMTQTARTVGVAPDLLELTLFQRPGSLDAENGAAE